MITHPPPPTPQHAHQYQRAYWAVVRRFGRRAPGRNILRNGFDDHHGATDRQVVASLAILDRALAPPVVPVLALGTPASTQTPVAAPVSAQAYTGTSGGLPACTWVPESGGNWNAYNPGSGAGGRYQIIPSTWAANGGTGSPQNASPAEQTRVAQNVIASQGIHAWSNC